MDTSLGCALSTITLFLCCIHFFHRRQSCKHPLLPDYPLLGMLPPVLFNLFRIHDFITEILKRHRLTGEFRGPWFTNMTYIITVDSLNVQHMLCKRFDNYVKGPEFREIFQAFGDGFITADFDMWKYHRTLLYSLLRQKSFETFFEKTIKKRIETSLIPTLEHVEKQGMLVDLQDVFNKFTFENICSVVLGHDPKCLSIDDFPQVAIEKAFKEAEECVFYRHTMPKFVWKFQRWLQIGQEKKMTHACKTIDQFLYSCIGTKREELIEQCKENNEEGEAQFDLLTALMRQEMGRIHDDKFLRDFSFNMFIAGRGGITSTLSWFFWLLSSNPLVEANIVEEIKLNFGDNEKYNKVNVLGMEEMKKLVYLHGAICETLRLFPPIPLERKQAIKADTLPSGHCVNANSMILFSLYAMGRVEEIWGKDYLEFRPERWISERGGIVYPPSHKFIVFNAGPRTCLGKDLSFIEIKMIAAAILSNYRVQVVEGNPITPSHSMILYMKHGLKVGITKRCI